MLIHSSGKRVNFTRPILLLQATAVLFSLRWEIHLSTQPNFCHSLTDVALQFFLEIQLYHRVTKQH